MLALACSTAPAERVAILDSIERGDGDGPLLVMLHGYGSRPEDLASFADRSDLPRGTRMSFPRAPEAVHPPLGLEGRSMWWRFTDDLSDLRGVRLPGLPAARERVRAFLDDRQARLGIASDRIVLGGFSQGAILALDVALHDDRPLAGIALLSATLVDEAEVIARVRTRRGLPTYVSHGTRDTVLPYERTLDLVARLREGGLDVRFTTFDGGHEVTDVVSSELAAFVGDVTR